MKHGGGEAEAADEADGGDYECHAKGQDERRENWDGGFGKLGEGHVGRRVLIDGSVLEIDPGMGAPGFTCF